MSALAARRRTFNRETYASRETDLQKQISNLELEIGEMEQFLATVTSPIRRDHERALINRKKTDLATCRTELNRAQYVLAEAV